MDLYGDLDKYENAPRDSASNAPKEKVGSTEQTNAGSGGTKVKMAFKPRAAVNKSLAAVGPSFKPRTAAAAPVIEANIAKAVSPVPPSASETAAPPLPPPSDALLPPLSSSSSSTFSFAGAITTQTRMKADQTRMKADQVAKENQDQVATDESQTNKSRKRSYSVGEDNLTWDVDNPYDPLKPNEYMKILEDRKNRRRKRALAKDNERYIKEQDRERDEIARERADAIKQGDMEKVAAIASRGGRGRGVTNLPAWMTAGKGADGSNLGTNSGNQGDMNSAVEDQFQDASLASSSSREVVERKRSRFIEPSCVLLLENMVAKIDVDDSLTQETSDECAKYGSVKRCLMHEMKDQSIRLFVLFENQASCIKACKDLDERFFAGRKVRATFYSEENFDKGDLEY